jgi:hypothetical protein
VGKKICSSAQKRLKLALIFRSETRDFCVGTNGDLQVQDFRLDTDLRELRSGAEMQVLEPQVFDLLVYLLKNRKRVVAKDELVQSVGGRTFLTAQSTQNQCRTAHCTTKANSNPLFGHFRNAGPIYRGCSRGAGSSYRRAAGAKPCR